MPARIDFTSQRLFVDQPMAAGAELMLDRNQTNYLVNVLRMREEAALLVFNGRDGEWRASLASAGKKAAVLRITAKTREQTRPGNIWLCFAPIKSARLDYMVQKAVEMGASRLVPIVTSRTQVELKNPDRLRANIVEAAEQCGVLVLPELAEPVRLARLPALFEPDRMPLFCDEMAEVANPSRALASLEKGAPLALLIGPEGGFDPDERRMILAWPRAVAISLGARILRADTAAIAALAAAQMAAGDWN
jgi:16S rRNA (uracil1498-N3)-methyltransferase